MPPAHSFFETSDGVVLVDGGFRAGAVTRGLEDFGLSTDGVTDVLLTHGHTDHLGVISELGDVRVWAMPDEEDLIAEESDGEVTVTNSLVSGEPLDLGGVFVDVFAIPGHTDGTAVFLVDGVLLLGDCAVVNRDGVLVPVPEKRSDDPAALVDNLRDLAVRLQDWSESIDWVAPSHSAPIAGFEALASF